MGTSSTWHTSTQDQGLVIIKCKRTIRGCPEVDEVYSGLSEPLAGIGQAGAHVEGGEGKPLPGSRACNDRASHEARCSVAARPGRAAHGVAERNCCHDSCLSEANLAKGTDVIEAVAEDAWSPCTWNEL